MDQFYQVIYGPNEDKLKHCGAAWLALSLLANVAGSNVTGFIGLLAILAVVTKSEYLLFLFLVLAPLSLLITLIYIWREPKTFGLVILQLLHAGIQGLAAWFAWCQFQELNADSGSYQVADGNANGRQGGQAGHADPFQSYVPPQGQQNAYHAEEQRQPVVQPAQEAQRDAKTENLI